MHNRQCVNATTPNLRFREARERLGLSPDELAQRCGLPSPCIWDIEQCEGDLTSCYSPREVRQFCSVLGIRSIALFADEIAETPVSTEELVGRIHDECRSRGITLEQFEEAVGWHLSACMYPPEQLLEQMTIDGLQWLCRELRIDWRRVLLSL